jgi:hypothetical protein
MALVGTSCWVGPAPVRRAAPNHIRRAAGPNGILIHSRWRVGAVALACRVVGGGGGGGGKGQLLLRQRIHSARETKRTHWGATLTLIVADRFDHWPRSMSSDDDDGQRARSQSRPGNNTLFCSAANNARSRPGLGRGGPVAVGHHHHLQHHHHHHHRGDNGRGRLLIDFTASRGRRTTNSPAAGSRTMAANYSRFVGGGGARVRRPSLPTSIFSC